MRTILLLLKFSLLPTHSLKSLLPTKPGNTEVFLHYKNTTPPPASLWAGPKGQIQQKLKLGTWGVWPFRDVEHHLPDAAHDGSSSVKSGSPQRTARALETGSSEDGWMENKSINGPTSLSSLMQIFKKGLWPNIQLVTGQINWASGRSRWVQFLLMADYRCGICAALTTCFQFPV